MTFKEYCDKYGVDYNKVLSVMKEYMIETDNGLTMTIDYESQDVQYQEWCDVTFEFYFNSTDVNVIKHYKERDNKNADDWHTLEWHFEEKDHLYLVFDVLYKLFDWGDSMETTKSAKKGNKEDLMDWADRLKSLNKPTN